MNRFPSYYIHYVAAFAAGFGLMVVEVAASRVVAPLIGASLYTWTAVIGVTLLGLSIGSVAGGVIADRWSSTRDRVLPIVCMLAALSVAAIIPFSKHVEWVLSLPISMLVTTTLVCSLLFLLPAFFFGALPPLIYTAHRSTDERAGRDYGLLSGLWSLGSIIGVFVTGFYFIATLGIADTLYVVAGLLSLTAFLIVFQGRRARASVGDIKFMIAGLVGVGLLIWLGVAGSHPDTLVFEQETNYYNAKVVDFQAYPELGANRFLVLDVDPHSVQTEKPSKKFYTDLYPIFSVFHSKIRAINVVGAGAYTLPKHLSEYYPKATVSVTELDPALEKIGRDFFQLDEYAITTNVGDARQIFSRRVDAGSTYDLIFGDAYNSFISVPWYLLTKEYAAAIEKHLSPDGLYAVNFISSLEGDHAELFHSVYKTMGEVFPTRYVFALGTTRDQLQNVIVIGSRSVTPISDEDMERRLKSLDPSRFLSLTYVPQSDLADTARHGGVLTDDYAPVESMMLDTMEAYFHQYLALYHRILG